MTIVPRAVLIVALVATTGLTTVLGVTDPAAPVFYPTKFLIWNLALAWVPLFMAVGFAALRRSVWQLPWLLGWLVFLPNSVYLVTDLSIWEKVASNSGATSCNTDSPRGRASCSAWCHCA